MVVLTLALVSRDIVRAATMGVKQAVFKAYRYRRDAQDAFDRALARQATRQYMHPEEAAHGRCHLHARALI